MSDGRPVIALPARSVRYAVCEAMGSAVPEGFRPQPPARPTSAAGADVAEGVAVDGVAADPAVFDTDAAPSYRYGVEHAKSLDGLSGGHKSRSTSPTPPAEHRPAWAHSFACEVIPCTCGPFDEEDERRARLSRWQEKRG